MKPITYPKLSVAAAALVAGSLLAGCTPPPEPVAPKPYELVVLDATGTDGVGAYGISADGSLIGGYAAKQIDGNPGTVGTVWDDNGSRTDTVPAAGLSAGVISVDNDGTAVGWSTNVAETDYPTRPAKIASGAFALLPGFSAPAEFGSASSVRNGVIVGTAVDVDEEISQPWVHAAGTTHSLGSFGGDSGYAYQVNASGQIVGWSQLAGDPFVSHGFVVDANDTLADATHLTGLGGNVTFARSINDEGVVVGDSSDGAGSTHAFIWTAAGGTEQIASPASGRSYVVARGINNSEQVIGFGPATAGGFEAWYWDESTGKRLLNTMVDLPTGWRVTDASGIANDGSIVATAIDGDGDSHAVVLRPRTNP